MKMSSSIPRYRMIFKVLVLGRNLPLQTGFVNRVSGERVTNQLYNTLGVSLGIAKKEESDNSSVVLQLWSLPLNERLIGLTKNFTKGHRGVIVLVKPDELDQLPSLLKSFSINPESNLLVAVVGDIQGIESELLRKVPFSEESLDIHSISSANDIITILCNQLQKKEYVNNNKISVVFLDENQCPLFEPTAIAPPEPDCTDKELDEIRSILLHQGLRVIADSCFVELNEGTAWISLRSGSVRLDPAICNYCRFDCKRQTNICIIAVDSGWTTQDIGHRALLTTAKILALSDRTLPSHVEMQIQRAGRCTRFELNPDLLEEDLPVELSSLHPQSTYMRKTLLEVASDRVKEGRLPDSAYNMLKRKLASIQKTVNN